MPAAIDLEGRRFACLEVISKAPSKAGARWYCLCDCGGTSIVRTSHLISRETKACGCLSKKGGRKRIETPESKLILLDLESGPSTDRDLSHVVGIHQKNVRKHLNDLRDAGKVRICGWERKRGRGIAIWKLADGKRSATKQKRNRRNTNVA